MQLLTKDDLENLPKLYATEGQDDPVVWCTFFTPDSNWIWYAIEFDGKDTFYGLVDGFEQELGYFLLSELLKVRGVLGLPVERDCVFTPCRLSKIMGSR